MPVHHNDLADDPLAYDRQRSFVAGQVSYLRVNALSEDQGAVLSNVDIDTDAAVENRRGFRKWGNLSALVGSDTPQGLFWFDYGANQFLLAVAGGKLYRCPSGGTWTLVTASATPSTTSAAYGDQIADTFWLTDGTGRGRFWTGAQLAAGSAGTAITDGASTATLFTGLRYRLFALNAATPDEIYCSKFLPTDATPFTLSSAILPFRVGEGTGEPTMAMAPWKNLFSLVVVKKGSIWVVDTSPAASEVSAATSTSTFGILQVGWVGAVAGRTVARASNDILFLSEDGVRSLARTMEDGEGKVSDPLSFPIHDFIRRINTAAVSKASAVCHAGRYLLSVPLDSSSVCNTLLVWNLRSGAWVVWDGVQPVAMIEAKYNSGPRRLMVLDARGHVLEYRGHVATPVPEDFRDNVTGSDVRPTWAVRTRGMTFGDPVAPKDLDAIELEFDRSEALVDVDVWLDSDASGIRLASKLRTGYPGWVLAPDGGLAADYPGSTLDCKLGEAKVLRVRKSATHFPDAREVMVEVREAADLSASELAESGALRLRGVLVSAYLETKEAET